MGNGERSRSPHIHCRSNQPQACLLYPHSCILLRKKFHIVLVKVPCNFNPISAIDLDSADQHLNHIPIQGPQVTERFQAVDLLTADSIHIRENAATVLFQGVQLPLLLYNGGINLFAAVFVIALRYLAQVIAQIGLRFPCLQLSNPFLNTLLG